MNKLKSYTFLAILLTATSAFSYGHRGTDITPKQIKSKYYIWSKKEKEPTKEKNHANIWFNSYSNKMDGYIILLSGKRLKGDIIVRRKWNLASVKKISENYIRSSGEEATRKVKNPAGVDIILEVKITNENITKTISTKEIKNYGPYFTTNEWALVKGQNSNSDKILKGSIEYSNGEKKDGVLTLNTHSYIKRKFDLRYHDFVFFAKNDGDKCDIVYFVFKDSVFFLCFLLAKISE